MTRVYTEADLEYAMENLGSALDYSVNTLGIGGQEFLNLFLISGIAGEFENGNAIYITGMSGRSLADAVFERCHKSIVSPDGEVDGDYTPEYWCGWILAYYQRKSGLSFRKILSVLSFEDIRNTYGVLHEADESKAAAVYDGIVRAESFLSRMRKRCGMTQAVLASASGVSLRSVQLYEQKQNDINKAQYNNLRALADALRCDIEDLLE